MTAVLRKALGLARRTFSEMRTVSGRNAVLQRLEMAVKRRRMSATPLAIHLEITNRCNLSCRTCGRNYWDNTLNPLGDMSMDTVEKLTPFLRRSRTAQVWGYGEALISPHFFEIMDYVASQGCATSLLSNGTTLTRDRIRKLVTAKLGRLFISLDGSTEETVRETRSGASLSTIIENVHVLNDVKRRLSTRHPLLSISFTATGRNVGELPDLVRLAGDLEMDLIAVRFAREFDPTSVEESVFDDFENTSRVLEETRRLGKNLGVSVVLQDVHEQGCTQPFDLLFVKWNGDVFGCCASAFHSVPRSQIMLGNLHEVPIDKLWNSDYIKQVRGELLGLRKPLNPICEICPVREATSESLRRF